MLITDKHVVIVGGGPGGLTLARLLQQAGASVRVYERDANPNVRQQGATLDLHEESGLRALRAAGLIEAFRQHYRPGADKMRGVDAQGNICLDDHDAATSRAYNEDRPEIDRGPLRDILINSLLPGTMVWDAHFVSMTPSGNGWTLHFKNGHAAYADIVIAADGANSKIRPLITGILPVYSGITVVEGCIYAAEKNVPHLNALVKGGKVFALGHEQSLILSAKGDGSLSFYTGTWETEDWSRTAGIDFSDRAQVYAWFKERFANWAPMWQELFATEQMYFVPRPMYHFPVDQRWEALPNLTMLGDAAHLMPPYAGEGVNMAMLDALELAECLTGNQFEDVHAAIAHFEREMCSRAAVVTAMTLDNTSRLHAPDALASLMEIIGQP